MKRVIIESPFHAPTDVGRLKNMNYARAAMMDSLHRGEAPFLSHLLYTQVLEDNLPDERAMGIEAGLAWGMQAHLTAVYADYDISRGMTLGIEHAHKNWRPVVIRFLGPPWSDFPYGEERDEKINP